METLRNIVQNILIIILLTTLLEMLLPDGDMRRYVRLVMGLFVIMVVINPVLSLFHNGVNLDAVSFKSSQTDGGLRAAVAKGEKLRMEQRVRVLAGLKEKINGQVLALARLNKSVNVTGVEVEMVDDPQSENFGQIKSIIVNTGSGTKTPDNAKMPAGGISSVRKVAPVEIEVPELNTGRPRIKPGTSAESGSSGQLREILADFYGLNPEQIKIIQKQ